MKLTLPFFQKQRVAFLACFVCLFLLLSLGGCRAEESTVEVAPAPPSFPVTVSLGENTFTIAQKPTKLVSLSPELTEALEEIGAGNLLVGISNQCEEITGVSGKTTCGTPLLPDLDAIEKRMPDYVLSCAPLLPSQQARLDEAGICLLLFPHPNSLEEIFQRNQALFLLCYGQTSGSEQAALFEQNFTEKLDAILKPAAAYAEITQAKSAVYLAYPDWTMATSDTLEGKLLEEMGLVNLGASGSDWQFPQEQAATLLPDVIFYDQSLDPALILQSEAYAQSPAVQKQQLFPLDFAAIHRQNLDMVDELSRMALFAYPDAYAGSK